MAAQAADSIVDFEVLRESFPVLFETFPELSADVIYAQLEQTEFDPDETLRLLKQWRCKGATGSAAQKRRKLQQPIRTNVLASSSKSATVPHIIDGTMSGDDSQVVYSGVFNAPADVVREGSVVADDSENDARLANKCGAVSGKSKSAAPASKRQRKSAAPVIVEAVPVIYSAEADEVLESETLRFPEEELMANDNDDEDDAILQMGDDAGIPCRTLDMFTVYDIANGNRLVTLDVIDQPNTELRASGIGAAIIEENEDEDEDDANADNDNDEESAPQTLKISLTTIFRMEIMWQDDGKSQIWILTQFGWYKLCRPSAQYAPFYDEVFKRTRLANMLIAEIICSGGAATLDQIIDNISGAADNCTTPNDYAVTMDARQVLLDNIEFIYNEVKLWSRDSGSVLSHIVAWTELSRLFASRSKSRSRGSGESSRKPRGSTGRQTVSRNINMRVLQERNISTVTPWIASLSKDLFRCTMAVAGVDGADAVLDKEVSTVGAVTYTDGSYLPPKLTKEHTAIVKWCTDPCAESDDRFYYDQILIDGEVIRKHDMVLIRNNTDYVWFGVIHYLFQEKKSADLKMHVQYYEHGSRTLLREVASSRELFLFGGCDDLFAECCVAKCNVLYVPPGQPEPPHAQLVAENQFFYRYYWHGSEDLRFDEAKLHIRQTDGEWRYCCDEERCDSCEDQIIKVQRQHPTLLPDEQLGLAKSGFQYRGHTYHDRDFVYLVNSNGKDEPYSIGQIVSIELPAQRQSLPNGKTTENPQVSAQEVGVNADLKVLVRKLGRCDHLLQKRGTAVLDRDGKKCVMDSRKVYLTDKLVRLSVDLLEGKCWVQRLGDIVELDEYRQLDDSFYYESSCDEALNPCDECQKQRDEQQIAFNKYRSSSLMKPLVGLDIFSGCGGLTVGLDAGGFVDTRYSIEFSPSAALTFRKNFPDAAVYNQCANVLLQRAIDVHQRGLQLEPAQDLQGADMAEIPAPGQVDFIYGGPPCQGFSGINRFKKAGDIKNSLISCMLSYADFYRPKYFLLENVRGMLAFKLGGVQAGENRIDGGIKMGVIKFIMRALTSMNYQCFLTLQQAGHYGVSQSRRRIFFVGVQRGLPLYNAPTPTHCFPRPGSLTVQVEYEDGSNPTRYEFNSRSNGHAPEGSVTVWDVTADLPPFEFKNPHATYPATEAELQSETARALTIPAHIVKVGKTAFVGEMSKQYASAPLCSFQRHMRSGVEQGALVHAHVTRTFNAETIERICNIPMRPGADHRDLPELLKPWCLSAPESAASRHGGWKGLYGRLDNDGHFPTALTDIQPMGKQGTVIHPTQKRVVSVRECARVQGFPDHFQFYSTDADVKDMHRQIGNAVPPPLARAIGRMILQSRFQQWRSDGEPQ